jgi:DNA ligase-1
MEHIKKPMLAAKMELASLQFPYLVSRKIDGIRCLSTPDGLVSRTFKRIPNLQLQTIMGDCSKHCLDGELYIPESTFNKTQSVVMSTREHSGCKYYVFDTYDKPMESFADRTSRAQDIVNGLDSWYVEYVPHTMIHSLAALQKYEQRAIESGEEGIMLRSPFGRYKSGRSTTNENGLLKMKRFEDDEAIVMDMKPLLINENEQTTDHLGQSKRSKHSDNLVECEMLGSIVCEWQGQILHIGSGFTKAQRIFYWNNKLEMIGKIVTFKYQPHGMKDLPRCPIFKSVRDLYI